MTLPRSTLFYARVNHLRGAAAYYVIRRAAALRRLAAHVGETGRYRLKSTRELPLLEDLDRPKHNHALQAARAVLIIAGSLVAANARDSRSNFAVSATVNAVARLEMQSAPTEVQVSAVDVRRGFIDVSEPTALTIRSNSPTGVVLDLMTVTPMASSVVVHGLASEQSLGAEGGTIVQRWHSPRTVILQLKFRFVLAPGLTAGRYPWPLRIAVRPLEAT
jgi:hypothetical protein